MTSLSFGFSGSECCCQSMRDLETSEEDSDRATQMDWQMISNDEESCDENKYNANIENSYSEGSASKTVAKNDKSETLWTNNISQRGWKRLWPQEDSFMSVRCTRAKTTNQNEDTTTSPKNACGWTGKRVSFGRRAPTARKHDPKVGYIGK